MASAKRVDLSLADKEQIIKALREPGAKQCNVAQLFGVSKSVVSRINMQEQRNDFARICYMLQS